MKRLDLLGKTKTAERLIVACRSLRRVNQHWRGYTENGRKWSRLIGGLITIPVIRVNRWLQIIDSKRRDAGAVDQARLESEARDRQQATPKRLNAHAMSGLDVLEYHSVCVRKPRCSSRF
jgi:hypothetical protein